VCALVVLVAMLAGVPVVLVAMVGVPAPSWMQIQRAWTLRAIDNELVLRLGAVLFLVLWSWFAATAVAEAWRVMHHRRTGRSLPPAEGGPSGWVKGVVRFVALSSAAASLMAPVGAHRVSATVAAPEQMTVAGCQPVAPVPDHRPLVVRVGGASGSAPGDATPADPASGGASSLVPYLSGMGTALLLAAGVVGTLESRRRRQWRSIRDDVAMTPHDVALVHTETMLRAVRGDDRLARLDVALRSIARDLARQRSRILAALVSGDGTIRVVVDGMPRPSAAEWTVVGAPAAWSLSPVVSLERLASLAGDVVAPCPTLVHLGSTDQHVDIFVDVEAVGVLSLNTPFADDVARSLAASLAFSPFMQGGHLVVCGHELDSLTEGGTVASAVRADSVDEAVSIARRLVGSTLLNARSASTFALRVLGAAGETWEPAVIIACGVGGDPPGSGPWSGSGPTIAPSSGLALVTDVEECPTSASGALGGWMVSFDGEHHALQPLDISFLPVGLGHHDVHDVMALVAAADVQPSAAAALPPPSGLPARIGSPSPATIRDSASLVDAATPPFVEPPWSLMVRVLGPVSVMDRAGTPVEFERSKSLELVVWLALHRERPTRSAARTALWDLEVRSATFANVVSDARRGLARAVLPLEGDEWIARTLTEDLPLHPHVVTDAELLAARLRHSRGLSHHDAIAVLRPGVELLRSLPLSGTNFLWSDAEGHTSALVVVAMSAAIELAERCRAVCDTDGVFWATGQGLKVLAGHEELIALRMRAHADKGDLSGVRNEWASYERALAADAWAAADPAPKLVALRKNLLG
jgi:hypothetical protein